MIAISSIGIISPLGLDVQEVAAALCEGESAAFPSETHIRRDGTAWLTAEVPPFEIKEYVTPKPVLDRNSALLLAACGSALKSAACDTKDFPYGRAGIAAGTQWGGLGTLELFFNDYLTKGPRLVKPLLFPHTYANTAVSLAAIEWGLSGEHQNFVSDETASGQAICEAAAAIEEGRADLMLAAGADALSAPLLRHLEHDCASDITPAEAGVALLLESAASMSQRKVTPLAHIHGYGCAATATLALRQAIERSGHNVDDITWAALTTMASESAERLALREVLGPRAIPLTAPASLCGELFGVSTAFTTACAIIMRHHNQLCALCPPLAADTASTPPGAGLCAIVSASAANAVALLI